MTSGGKAPLRRCPSMGSAFDWGWSMCAWCPSVSLVFEGVEVVEAAGGGHPGDVLRLDMVEAAKFGQRLDGAHVGLGQLLDPGVRAERGDLPGHVDDGLVERVPERVADVATDQHDAGLGHEPAHVADVPADQDRPAL